MISGYPIGPKLWKFGNQSSIHLGQGDNLYSGFGLLHEGVRGAPGPALVVGMDFRDPRRAIVGVAAGKLGKSLDAAIALKIPAGGSAGLRIKTPAQAFANTMRLELNDPPEGITLAEVVPGEGETKLVLHSDASKIKPGATGSLVVNIVAKMGKQKAKPGGKARMNQNSVVLGVLPAIRYEIVAPALAAK